MYQPKTYPEEPCFHIGYGFKNPALCRVNGVLYSYCCLCKTYIGNEYDTNWYKLIKQEYCDSCRLKVQTEQNSNRQKKFRKKNKQEKSYCEIRMHYCKMKIDCCVKWLLHCVTIWSSLSNNNYDKRGVV